MPTSPTILDCSVGKMEKRNPLNTQQIKYYNKWHKNKGKKTEQENRIKLKGNHTPIHFLCLLLRTSLHGGRMTFFTSCLVLFRLFLVDGSLSLCRLPFAVCRYYHLCGCESVIYFIVVCHFFFFIMAYTQYNIKNVCHIVMQSDSYHRHSYTTHLTWKKEDTHSNCQISTNRTLFLISRLRIHNMKKKERWKIETTKKRKHEEENEHWISGASSQ